MTTKATGTLGILLITGLAQALPPEIQPISDWEMDEDSFLSVPVVITDPDSPVLSYWVDVEDTHVRVSFDEANMMVHVNPQPNWNGATQVMVGVEDGDGTRTVDMEYFMVTVLPLNDCPLPVAQALPSPLQTFEDQPLQLDHARLQSYFYDADWAWGGDELILTSAAFDLGFVQAVEDGFLLSTDPNVNGEGLFTFVAGDGECQVEYSLTVLVQPLNDSPVQDQAWSQVAGTEDQPLELAGLTSVFHDVEGQELSVSLPQEETAFSAQWDASTGMLLLTPPSDANGMVQLTLEVSDGQSASTATLDVNLDAVNDAPRLPELTSLILVEDEPLQVDYAIVDVDGPALEVVVESHAPEVRAYWLSESALLSVEADAQWHGQALVVVRATDGADSSWVEREILVTVDAVNDAPSIAFIEDQQIQEDGALLLEVAVSDVDADSLSLGAASSQSGLEVWWEEDGRLRLQPVANWNGTSQVTLSVDDGQGRTVAERQFQVTVQPVNDLPWAQPCGDWSCGLVEDAAAFRAALLAGDMRLDLADADQEALTLSWFINGQLVSSHQLQTSADTLFCLSLPAPPAELLDGSIVLHAEVADGAGALNPAGETCAWELDFTGMASVQPLRFALGPCQPNPFNPSTHLPFVLESAGETRLAIYNLQGALVEVLQQGWLPAGAHDRVWHAGGQASGLYLAVLESAERTLSTRLTLIK